MSSPVSVTLVGIGGYGETYLNALLNHPPVHPFRIDGAVDPYPNRSSRLGELERMGVPVFSSLEEYYQRNRCDLVVISSPIQMHCDQVCLSLAHDSNVLCEKPLAALVQEAARMIETRDKTERFVAIGYQWSFSEAILGLKADIRAGLFGRPRRLKTLVLWPRDYAYYSRNNWAGMLQDPAGRFVLDSPVNNANAHYLHNMLFVLGEATDESAVPKTVTAELYRANAITNYDSAALRVVTSEGVEILFYAAHASDCTFGPVFEFEFEKATVTYVNDGLITAKMRDGSEKTYANPNLDMMRKVWKCIEAVRSGKRPVCGIETARAQTIVMNAASESSGITNFPEALVAEEETKTSRRKLVRGLGDTFKRLYGEGKLPGEAGVEWARTGRTINVEGYAHFPSGR